MTGRRPSKKPTGRRAILAFVTVVGLIGMLAAAPLAFSHPSATTPKKVVKVRARIRVNSDPNQVKDLPMAQRGIFFTPSVINVGTVIIVISNGDDDAHIFQINGVTSRRIGPGGRATIKVTFKRPGRYPVGLTDDDLFNVGPGVLKVVK